MATRTRCLADRPDHGERAVDKVRCPNCGLLLAKTPGFGSVEVRWKELWLRVWGRVRIRCRKCGTICDI
ncbi:MAG: hypothetical protein KAW17_03875 [Candidatus Eisenbacteria sp.]|nr:hypothetical protein [Candidatus Eisenbacteria bacterium]